MDRFFADKIQGDLAFIDSEEEIKHISRTLRMQEGDVVEIFDGKGKEYIARLDQIDKKSIQLKVMEEVEINRELNTFITVYQGIPKAQKMELIVQKLTEIGVSRMVPVKFERCIRLIDEKEVKQIQRWQKIALEACKQSKRTLVPLIEKSMDIKTLAKEQEESGLMILHVTHDLSEILNDKAQVIALNQVGPVSVAGQERSQLIVADASQNRRISDLVTVEMQDRQDGAIACRIHELVGVPGRGQRTGLCLAVADHTSHQQVRVVESSAVGVCQRVAELTPLVDGARCLRCHM